MSPTSNTPMKANPISLASLTLVRANRDQTIDAERRSFHEWGRGLSLSQYLKVHEDLNTHTHASEGRLSACHMLRLLHHVVGIKEGLPAFPVEWGTPPSREGFGNGKFSVLYSDIGPDFYETCGPSASSPGWLAQNSSEVVWKVDRVMESAKSSAHLVAEAELEIVLAKDAALIKQEMAIATVPCCSFTANNGVNGYHVQRTLMRAERKKYPRPDIFGALLPENDRQPLAFLTWTPGGPTLAITRFRANSESLPALLGAAKKMATINGSHKIVAWAVPEGLQEACKATGGVIQTRNDHLPCIHVYDVHRERFEWIHNERPSNALQLIKLATKPRFAFLLTTQATISHSTRHTQRSPF
ncbi:hypothetical protein DACRYDRAFT_114071 [Dacryopinax primogenitus]|uniref:LYC1 C-terminal domain-containing protein n=1 Tax=Dacryopinax primogenitus (strain DJM 731) TaxID=1858805 RepID=M5GDQ6_DACPD|nr:uncharacterized protein DACRYDRAFT_114071 [Dacryopinax primogenitus]EJU04722.1 hypothetical protein DACRYDRAFT_114071 [Dacryopinax primogenitus]